MEISELIAMCERRLIHFHALRGSAVALGDVQQITEMDTRIFETQTTLNQLRTLGG